MGDVKAADLSNKKLGFIGAGNMASALMKGLIHSGFPAGQVWASDVDADRLKILADKHGLRTTTDNAELVKACDVVVLSVKPQVIDRVLVAIGKDIRPEQLVVSVAAGVPISAMEARFPAGTRVVRTMPNTPATVDAGATAISAGTSASADDLATAHAMFSAVGRVVTLDETLLDAVTGLAGFSVSPENFFGERTIPLGFDYDP